MSTMSLLLTVFFVLLLLVLIMTIIRNTYWGPEPYDHVQDEVETSTHTHTTVTTVTEEAAQPQYTVVGNLVRQQEGTQFFVMDPADNEKIWVNSGDDMYRDADGKIWKLM